MVGMERHGQAPLDQASDPLGGPQSGGKPVRLRIVFKPGRHLSQLRAAQTRFASRAPWMVQRLDAALFPRGIPASCGLVAHAESSGDFGFGQALFEPSGGFEAASLQGLEITFHAFGVSHTPLDNATPKMFTIFYRNQ
jgi:hypothetical protein